MKKNIIFIAVFLISLSSFGEELLPCKNQVHSFIFDLCDGGCRITRFDLDVFNQGKYFVDYNFDNGPTISQIVSFEEKSCRVKLLK